MAVHGQSWDHDDQFDSSSCSCSDDSPILSHRHDRRRYAPHAREEKEDIERRSALSVLAKFFLFSSAMILFCVLMYIPVYNKANYQMPKAIVQGWSTHTNRDTKLYVQPNNVTTIHVPKYVCNNNNYKDNEQKEKLFLLIVVCSSTVNFERRQTIRETWGSYKNYLEHSKVFKKVTERYKKYNYTHDLYPNASEKVTNTSVQSEREHNLTSEKHVKKKQKRDLNGFSQLLPELAKALKKNLATAKTVEDANNSNLNSEGEDAPEPVLPEFDMNDVLDEKNTESYSYDYESNVMRIPPRGETDYEESNLDKILNLLKQSKSLEANLEEVGKMEKDFKLVFLLGLPDKDNNSKIQNEIDAEVNKYGDILQEGFIDSYNNLTLKSIMMLKWVTNQCNESVRYILKSDDDMYINLPNLVQELKNRSRLFDARNLDGMQKEYLLMGDLISGAKPVLDAHNKWYSPRYMYSGRVYPRYLSGTAYALSRPAASALYRAALTTTYFHLEDIYITGLCALRSVPRITPLGSPLFSYRAPLRLPCWAHARVSAHHLAPNQMRAVSARLRDEAEVDRWKRMAVRMVYISY